MWSQLSCGIIIWKHFTSRAGAANILPVLWIFCIFNKNTFPPPQTTLQRWKQFVSLHFSIIFLPAAGNIHAFVAIDIDAAHIPLVKTRSAQANTLNASQFSWRTCRTHRLPAVERKKMVRSPQHQPCLLRCGRRFMRSNCQKLHF